MANDREHVGPCTGYSRCSPSLPFRSCILILLLCCVDFSYQQRDPLKNFCRRFGHQTAVIDDKLYIDGGLVNWNPISQFPNNESNSWLLYNDLTSGDQGEPQLYANLSKNATIPDLVGGILWADDVNKRFYLFGGEYYETAPVTFDLLSYDVLNDYWVSFGPPSSATIAPAWGAGVSISERGEGYYYGGWNSNTTTPGYSGGPVAVSNMIIYEMDTNSWTTNEGPDSNGRAEGVMVYIPASDRGLLVYFGGISQSNSTNGTVTGSPMDNIFIYDIASNKWYSQTATGDVPGMRRRFCAGATWAPDRSSYNIYLYGGAGLPPDTAGYDDVYILTLPSFIWIKWFPISPGEGNPHNSLTCNVINGAQMLIIGGTFPLKESCDAINVWGTHSLDLGKQNPDNNEWMDYRPNLTSYVVPEEIIYQVGGNSLGGATVTAPATWLNRDLPIYFTRNASNPVRTPTRVIPTSVPTSTATSNSTTTSTSAPLGSSPVLSKGAIIGIAVGGAAFIILIGLGCFFCLRGRRRKGPSSPPVVYPANVVPAPYSPVQYHTTSQYNSMPYPQQSQNLAELPEASPVPIYNVEPKYDTTPTQPYRNGSIQDPHPQVTEATWAQRQPSPGSPYLPQDYHPVPTQSPPPSELATVRSNASDSVGSRQPLSAFPSPSSYKARRPVTPGSDRHFQYPQYS